MRDREEILTAHMNGVDADLIEVLLDIRDQLRPAEVIAERILSQDRVVIQIGYYRCLLSDNMTAEDVATVIRFFDDVRSISYDNKVEGDRPDFEIKLVPRDKIVYPEIYLEDSPTTLSSGDEGYTAPEEPGTANE